MNLVTLKRQFLEYLEIERSCSEKTIENYDRYLTRFLVFAKVKQPKEITEEQILEFRDYLQSQPGAKIGNRIQPMKKRTQNYYLIALRNFLKFMRRREIESVLPERIELTKVSKSPLPTISKSELKRLLTVLKTETLQGKRDRAIIELLFSTGLRVSELCSLASDEVDITQDKFSVRGKGGKIRVVFLTEEAKTAIGEYLTARKDIDKALFVRYGKKAHLGNGARITPRCVQRLLKHYAKVAGITYQVTPQTIRHCFATNLLNKGVNLRSVQILLGHDSIGTTQIYLQAPDTPLLK